MFRSNVSTTITLWSSSATARTKAALPPAWLAIDGSVLVSQLAGYRNVTGTSAASNVFVPFPSDPPHPARRATASTAPAEATRRISRPPPSSPSRPFQDDQRDFAAGPGLVLGVARIRLDDMRPQALALLRRRHPRADLPPLRAHLDGRIRVRLEVVEPRRVLRIAALRGHDHQVVAAGDVVADDPVGRAVDDRVNAHQPAKHGPAAVRELQVSRAAQGTSTSLPVVRRPRMSSWARLA